MQRRCYHHTVSGYALTILWAERMAQLEQPYVSSNIDFHACPPKFIGGWHIMYI